MTSGVGLLREHSAAVFGNRYFVDVVVAIAERAPLSGDAVTARMIAAHSSVADGLVRLVLTRLVAGELLIELPPDRPRGARYHQVQRDGRRWAALVELCAQMQTTAAIQRTS